MASVESFCSFMQSSWFTKCLLQFEKKQPSSICPQCSELFFANHICSEDKLLCSFEDCKDVILRKDLQTHYTNDCLFATSNCKKCLRTIRKIDIHLCPNDLLKCQFCNRLMARKQLKKHLTTRHIKCSECNQLFNKQRQFAKHLKVNIENSKGFGYLNADKISYCKLFQYDHKEVKDLVKCSCCCIYVKQTKLWDHLQNNCKSAVIKCWYCKKQHPFNAKKCFEQKEIKVGSTFLYLQPNQNFVQCKLVMPGFIQTHELSERMRYDKTKTYELNYLTSYDNFKSPIYAHLGSCGYQTGQILTSSITHFIFEFPGFGLYTFQRQDIPKCLKKEVWDMFGFHSLKDFKLGSSFSLLYHDGHIGTIVGMENDNVQIMIHQSDFQIVTIQKQNLFIDLNPIGCTFANTCRPLLIAQ